MDAATLGDWERTTRALFSSLRTGNSRQGARVLERVWRATLRRTADGTLDVRPAAPPTGPADPALPSADGDDLRAAWLSVEYALDLVTGARRAIPDGERDAVLALAHDPRVAAPPSREPDPRGGDTSGRVRAAIEYGTGDGRYHLGRVVADVPPLDPSEAPVACRLRAGDGSWLDVRRVGDAYLRPVLAPGGWRPIDLPGFRLAAEGARPWPDSPFARYAPRDRHQVPLAAYLHERVGRAPDHVAALAAERDAMAANLRLLVSIDGIVHRETSAPVLCPVVTFLGEIEGRIDVTWRLDGLCGLDDLSTWSNGRRPCQRPLLEGVLPFGQGHMAFERYFAFGAAEHAEASAVAARLAATLPARVAFGSAGPLAYAPSEVVRLVAPELLSQSERPFARALLGCVVDARSIRGSAIDVPDPDGPRPDPAERWQGLSRALEGALAQGDDASAELFVEVARGIADETTREPRRDVETILRAMLPMAVAEAEAWLALRADVPDLSGFVP